MGHKNKPSSSASKVEVIDFNSIREKKLEEKRRNTKRVFFKNLLKVYCLDERLEMFPVQLVDVSEEGCAFQISYDPRNPWPKSLHSEGVEDRAMIPLRIYFTSALYLEIFLKIQNINQLLVKNSRQLRIGCLVDQTTQSYLAYQQFVKFLRLCSEQAHQVPEAMPIFSV